MKKLTLKLVTEVYNRITHNSGDNIDFKNIITTDGRAYWEQLNPNNILDEDTINGLFDYLNETENLVFSGSRWTLRFTKYINPDSDWDYFTTDEETFEWINERLKSLAFAQQVRDIDWCGYQGAVEIYKYRLIRKDGKIFDIQISLVEKIMDRRGATLASVAKRIVLGQGQTELIAKYGDRELREAFRNAQRFYDFITTTEVEWIKWTHKGEIYGSDSIREEPVDLIGTASPYVSSSLSFNVDDSELIRYLVMGAKLLES